MARDATPKERKETYDFDSEEACKDVSLCTANSILSVDYDEEVKDNQDVAVLELNNGLTLFVAVIKDSHQHDLIMGMIVRDKDGKMYRVKMSDLNFFPDDVT